MDILQALDLIKDYSFSEEQEQEVDKIINRIKDTYNDQNLSTTNNENNLTRDIDYLLISAVMKMPLINVLFKEEEPEKIKELDDAIEILKDYKESIKLVRKLGS